MQKLERWPSTFSFHVNGIQDLKPAGTGDGSGVYSRLRRRLHAWPLLWVSVGTLMTHREWKDRGA